jgi:putative tricarboxylic transport membrane protein
VILRSDHIAGGIFVALGALIFAISGDLPFGTLSFPGSGFMPKLVATLLIIFGGILVLRASESGPFSQLPWSDLKHAALVIVVTGAAIALYLRLGFIITILLMIFGLLTVIERRNALRAVAYSVGVTLIAYGVFQYLLKAPLPTGPFGF